MPLLTARGRVGVIRRLFERVRVVTSVVLTSVAAGVRLVGNPSARALARFMVTENLRAVGTRSLRLRFYHRAGGVTVVNVQLV